MKKYILITILLLSQFSGDVFALEECSGDLWTNCVGIHTDSNGVQYTGEFKYGKPDGQGTMIWANGNQHTGEWKDGKPDGQGTYIWAVGTKFAGDQYIGEWKDFEQHGQGTYIRADGTIQTGIWENHEYLGQ